MRPAQYNHIAKDYNGIETTDGQKIVIAAMTPHAHLLKDKTVLDLACGTGYWTRWAIENGATSAIGMDISEEMIAGAKLADTYNGKIQYRGRHLIHCLMKG